VRQQLANDLVALVHTPDSPLDALVAAMGRRSKGIRGLCARSAGQVSPGCAGAVA
jgi:hypothetical protein